MQSRPNTARKPGADPEPLTPAGHGPGRVAAQRQPQGLQQRRPSGRGALTELGFSPTFASTYVSVLGSTASSASRIFSTGMSSLALLVDSTSFSPRSLPRCRSSCTAAARGGCRSAPPPPGPEQHPLPAAQPQGRPGPGRRALLRPARPPPRLCPTPGLPVAAPTLEPSLSPLVNSFNYWAHQRLFTPGGGGPALGKLTIQRGSRQGVKRALMSDGLGQSQEGFLKQAAVTLKGQENQG